VTYFKCYRTNPKLQTHGEVGAQENQKLDLTKVNVEHQEIVDTKEKYNK